MASLVDYILIQKKTLNDIATAIRTKKGSTGLIKVVDMANEISTIQGTSTTRGSCAILVGGTFSYIYGAKNKDPKVYCPSCITYTDDGGELVFTATSAGSGTVTVVSGSVTLLVYSVTVTDLASVCNHTSFKTEITTPALCSRIGVKTHTCNTCQTTWTEDIPRLEHSWGDPYPSDAFLSGYGRRCEECGELEELSCPHTNTASKITKYATCYYTGTKSTICNDCGAVVGTETIPKGEHNWSEVYANEDDFSQGWGRKCQVSACGVTQEDVECPHKESTSAITKVSTCTSPGTRTYTCKVCKATTGTETIPKREHTWSESYPSDEFVNGYGRKCLVCGALDNSIACPHTSSSPIVTKVATCTATGTYTYYCDACGAVTGTETIGREPHNYDSVVTAPTCTAEGYTVHTCRVCGNTYTDTVQAARGHRMESDWVVYKAPTCTEKGIERRYCSNCNYYESRYVELGHSYSSVVTPATCTTGGYTTYTCSRCGDTYKSDYTGAEGHDWSDYPVEYGNGLAYECKKCGAYDPVPDETCDHSSAEVIDVVSPTCTEDGYTTYRCSNCNYEWSEIDGKLGHNYISSIVDPTCTEEGYTSHTCSRCGDTYDDDTKDALGHDSGEPQLTNTPTCKECAHYEVTCTRCGFLINEYDDDGEFGDHSFSTVEFAPTCTEAGYTRYVCDVCHEVREFPGDAALGHDYVLVSDSSQSSGASMVCSRCGDTEEASYDCDILGHETSDGEYDMPDGSTAFKCKHCGEFY